METQNMVEKRFEKLEDFNLIYIADLKANEMPKIIIGNLIKRYPAKVSKRNFFLGEKLVDNPKLNEEVINAFKLGEEEFIFENIVYVKTKDPETGEICFDSFNDMTDSVYKALNIPEIKGTLRVLQSSTAKPAISKEILSLPGFNSIAKDNWSAALYLKEDTPKGNNLRSCKIILNINKDNSEFSLELGTLNYNVYGRRTVM